MPPPTTAGNHEQAQLVHQPRRYRLSGEVRTAHRDVMIDGCLQSSYRVGLESVFDPCPSTRYRPQGCGEHDLVGRLPGPCEVLDNRRLVGTRVRSLPGQHCLVHPTPVEVCADWPFEVVDEGEDLFVRLCPVESAMGIFDIAVKRTDRGIDEPGHGDPLNYLLNPRDNVANGRRGTQPKTPEEGGAERPHGGCSTRLSPSRRWSNGRVRDSGTILTMAKSVRLCSTWSMVRSARCGRRSSRPWGSHAGNGCLACYRAGIGLITESGPEPQNWPGGLREWFCHWFRFGGW